MSSLWDFSLTKLHERVASLEPTPGGGSVSVLSAGLGLGLVQKGIRVSFKRAPSDSLIHHELRDLEMRAASAFEPLKRYADVDSEAFQRYMKAAALPKATEEEKAIRRRAIEEGLLYASRIPLEAAEQMKRCLGIAEAAIRVSKESVLSDVAGGALMIATALRATLLNVDSNLSGISDSFLKQEVAQKRRQLELETAAQIETVLEHFQQRLSHSRA